MASLGPATPRAGPGAPDSPDNIGSPGARLKVGPGRARRKFPRAHRPVSLRHGSGADSRGWLSLLHAWQALAPGHARHSPAARGELVKAITRYSDACGTPVTIIFDGQNSRSGPPLEPTPKNVEVLYTRTGQTADAVIERVTHLLRPYGEVLVVSNDNAERDLVIGLGGMASSCENFVGSSSNSSWTRNPAT